MQTRSSTATLNILTFLRGRPQLFHPNAWIFPLQGGESRVQLKGSVWFKIPRSQLRMYSKRRKLTEWYQKTIKYNFTYVQPPNMTDTYYFEHTSSYQWLPDSRRGANVVFTLQGSYEALLFTDVSVQPIGPIFKEVMKHCYLPTFRYSLSVPSSRKLWSIAIYRRFGTAYRSHLQGSCEALLFTDVSVQPIGPIFKDKAVQKELYLLRLPDPWRWEQ
jgi:hypothetical protein